ncbi:MAG: NACHT domain-containing protein [Leptolyngbya sp. SIO3F4]|nr:NACHT domain-containing protein [Leptolyngbya sp. SIO3F4]
MTSQPSSDNRDGQNSSQQQSFEDIEIKGDKNVFNSIQGKTVHVVNLSVCDPIPEGLEKLSIANINSVDQADYDSRRVLLNKVKKYWIQGVLEKSLYANALIELGLEERLDAVQDPFNRMQAIPDQYRRVSIQGQSVDDVFNQMGRGRTLLILGEPGSGKTITLLKLAKTFLSYAEENLSRLIPVVFNLSSWLGQSQTIKDWLIGELRSKYQVSRTLAESWITNQQLLLLLDGLDEVEISLRGTCIKAINSFLEEHGRTEVVICSRAKDYENLAMRLQVQEAIYIKPLTSEQVDEYLDRAGERLKSVKSLLSEDSTLQDLVKSPLMLNIVSLSYQDTSLEALQQINPSERYQHLLKAYINQMFHQHRANNDKFPREKVILWLSSLARKMKQESQSIFLIEEIQPSWLETKRQLIIYRCSLLLVSGLIGCFSGGFSGFLSGGLRGEPGDGINWQILNNLNWNLNDGLHWMLVSGIAAGIMSAMIVGLGQGLIEPVEIINLSWKDLKKSLFSRYTLNKVLIGGLLGTIGFSLSFQLDGNLALGALLGLLLGALFGLFVGIRFGLKSSEIETKTVSNQGIWQSVINASFSGLSLGVLGGLAVGIIFNLLGEQLFDVGNYGFLIGSLSGGLHFALIGVLLNEAGKACQRHFVLRLVLWGHGYMPWNYVRFLDYVTKCIFMRQVGGGYIFVHRKLLEHFVKM